MNKLKKIVLSVSIVVTMLMAFVMGLASNSNNIKVGKVIATTGEEVVTPKAEKPKTHTYQPGEIRVEDGTDTINFSYIPEIHSKEGTSNTVAYKYVFKGIMEETAINLKYINVENTGVTVRYKVSDEAINVDEVVDAENDYKIQTIARDEIIYIYVIFTPDTNESVEIKADVVWWLGKPQQVVVGNNIDGTPRTQTIVNGQDLDIKTFIQMEEDMELPEGYYVDGYYSDKELTKPITKLEKINQTIFTRFANMPINTTTLTEGDDGYTITAMTDFPADLVIPRYVNGKPIVALSEKLFYQNTTITSVSIPNTVTTLGAQAFRECSNLTTINIPKSVTSMGNSAFAACANLVNVNIDNGVAILSQTAFASCTALTEINIPDSVTTFGAAVFQNCASLKSLIMPDSITSIGTHTFYGCSALESVTISKGLTSLPELTFSNCINLKSIDIPSGITSLGNAVFQSCESLTEVVIPETVISMGTYTFNKCIVLEKVVLPDNITTINERTFSSCHKLSDLTMSKNITSIGSFAFYYNTVISNLNLGDYNFLTSIGDYAFHSWTALKEMILPDSLERIGKGAFGSCISLTSVTFKANGGNTYWNVTANEDYTSDGTSTYFTTTDTNIVTLLTSTYVEKYLYSSKELNG